MSSAPETDYRGFSFTWTRKNKKPAHIIGTYSYHDMINGRPSYLNGKNPKILVWYDTPEEDDARDMWVVSDIKCVNAQDPSFYGYCEDEAEAAHEIESPWFCCSKKQWIESSKVGIVFDNSPPPTKPGGLGGLPKPPRPPPNSAKKPNSVPGGPLNEIKQCSLENLVKLKKAEKQVKKLRKRDAEHDRRLHRLEYTTGEVAKSTDLREEFGPQLAEMEKAEQKLREQQENRKEHCEQFDTEEQAAIIKQLENEILGLQKKITGLCYDEGNARGKRYMRQEDVRELYKKGKLEHSTAYNLKEFLREKRNSNFWMEGRGYIHLGGNKDQLVKRVKKILAEEEKNGWKAGKKKRRKSKKMKRSLSRIRSSPAAKRVRV